MNQKPPKVNKTQMNDFKDHVAVRRLEAEEAKAIYEKYYYTIEASKLREEYNKVMQENLQHQLKMREELANLTEVAKQNAEILNAEKDALPQ